MDHVVAELGVSERRACQVLGQHRSTQRKVPQAPDDEAALIADMIELARQYGRYGYRRITKMLRTLGKFAREFSSDLEIMCLPFNCSQTLFILWPKRVPEPAARTIDATVLMFTSELARK